VADGCGPQNETVSAWGKEGVNIVDLLGVDMATLAGLGMLAYIAAVLADILDAVANTGDRR
jgi:hypothetical protein